MDPHILYGALLKRYGVQGWWPAADPLEMMVGAVLVQNTTWQSAARAIDRLRDANSLSAQALATLPDTTLQALIQPSGTFRVKAKRIKNLVTALISAGGPAGLAAMSTPRARRYLLGIHGVGAETADAILVYAMGRAAFVVDAYARRLMLRMTEQQLSDDDLRAKMLGAFPDNYRLGELHALIVAHGKQHCRRQPQCTGCPLNSICTKGLQTLSGSRCSDR